MGNMTPIAGGSGSGSGGGTGGEIVPVNLRDALEERYLAYALSTITSRALPDVRDGLKPVHRRIVYTMRQLRLDPDAAYKKCAKIVGDVMGNFHPHGDQSIYDALVRLAQDFAVRYPLVDGQGNFGNVDGDNAAAYRYTEARMTDVAALMLEGIREDAVDFRATYNEEDEEPVVLPGAFPNLLANGAAGIAVGMATSIPPHNAAEICDAALHLIKSPGAATDTLLKRVRGPDFPTGGVVVDDAASIAKAYETGRGSFRLRARWEREDLGRGQWQVVVTEIPYQAQKSKLIEKIAELMNAKRLPLVADMRDESAEDVRVVVEPRSRSVDPAVMMEQLFRLSDLETRVPLNMNVLSGGRVPKVMGLREVLLEWLAHRKEVLQRRFRFRLGEIEKRLEVLAGYLVAYLNIDEVIRIIRESEKPKPALIERFGLTDVQAEAVLNLRLRRLHKLEEIELRSEHEALSEEKRQIEGLLASDEKQWKGVAVEIRKVRDTFGPATALGARRTNFAEVVEIDADTVAEAMIEREPITVVISQKGWVRAAKGHLDDTSGLKFKDGDKLRFALPAQTTDRIVLFATNGRFYTLGADKLPGGRGHGEPLRITIDMDNDADLVSAFVHDPKAELLVASTEGNGFRVSEKEVVATTRKGKGVLNVKAPVEAALCQRVEEGADRLAVVGENRKMVVFPLDQVPQMTRGKGVRLQRYKDGGLKDARTFKADDGLTWIDSAGRTHTRAMKEIAEYAGDRGQAGRLAPRGFPKTGRFG